MFGMERTHGSRLSDSDLIKVCQGTMQPYD